MTEPTRLLPLMGAYNFRDLGGYPATGGRQTRWGRLFRSDTLQELTPEDLVILRELGLASVIDLRTTAEVQRAGRGPLAGQPLRYLHASLLQENEGRRDRPGSTGTGIGTDTRTGAGAGAGAETSTASGLSEAAAAPARRQVDIAERYLSYLETGAGALAEAFGLMADPASYPLVFHCFAGKDRTGALAALVLQILGVEREVIVEDYVLTATRMHLIMDRLRRDPEYGDRVDEMPPSTFEVVASTMEQFLDGLDQRFGGARTWALGAGIPATQLDALTGLLLD